MNLLVHRSCKPIQVRMWRMVIFLGAWQLMGVAVIASDPESHLEPPVQLSVKPSVFKPPFWMCAPLYCSKPLPKLFCPRQGAVRSPKATHRALAYCAPSSGCGECDADGGTATRCCGSRVGGSSAGLMNAVTSKEM